MRDQLARAEPPKGAPLREIRSRHKLPSFGATTTGSIQLSRMERIRSCLGTVISRAVVRISVAPPGFRTLTYLISPALPDTG